MRSFSIYLRDFPRSLLRSVLPEQRRLQASEIIRLNERVNANERRLGALIAGSLSAKYPQLSTLNDKPNAEINRHEERYYSQNGEDGIILYLFSVLGATDHRFVEIGIGMGDECNTANLSIGLGWTGLMLELNKHCVSYATRYFGKMAKRRPIIVEARVTAENVNSIIKNHNITGEIDLLSVDIDGNDYWVFRAIDVISPRVVVIEYNASFGPERALSVAYDPGFDPQRFHSYGWYHGASLAALTKLANAKGYVLAGCDSNGVNAFFVRKDLTKDIQEVSPSQAYYPCLGREWRMNTEEQFATIRHFPLVEV